MPLDYLAGSRDVSALLREADQWLCEIADRNLTREEVSRIAKVKGIEFATAVLYEYFVKSRKHGPVVSRIHSLRKGGIVSERRLNATLVIVPGAFYIEHPWAGGDGRCIMELAADRGCKCKRIPLKSVGTLHENAEIIVRWLREQPDERIILASLSKGGADLKMALRQAGRTDAFSKVIAWVNVCGTLSGSPAVDWMLARRRWKWFFQFLYWWRGRNFQFIHDLRSSAGGPLDFRLELPHKMNLINIIGFPLKHHLSNKHARRCHPLISPLGPNDGTMLLSDALSLPGSIYPVWGTDHYFQPESMAKNLMTAVLEYLGEEMELFEQDPMHPGSAESIQAA